MKLLIIALLCLGLALVGFVGITLSLPMQAFGLLPIGIASLLGACICYRKRLDGGYGSILLLLVLLSFIYFATRAIFSPVVDLATEDMFLILSGGILYLLAGYVIKTINLRMALACVVVLLLVCHLGSAVAQLVGSDGYSAVSYFSSGVKPEGSVITGMYGYRGSFANFSMIAGMLALCLGLWGRFPLFIKALFVILGFIAIGFACLAGSRSAMISLVGGGLTLLILMWISVGGIRQKVRCRTRATILSLGVIGIAAAVMGTVWVLNHRVQDRGLTDVIFDSGSGRMSYWAMALEQSVESPVIGSGSRSYSYGCFRHWSPSLDAGAANPEFVHNEYLQVLVDYGFVGLLLTLVLFGAHLFMGWSKVQIPSVSISNLGLLRGSNSVALAMAGTVGMVMMLIHVVFDFRTHLMANLLLLVCCMVWVLPEGEKKVNSVTGNRWCAWLLVLVLVVAGSAATYLGVIQLRGGLPLLQQKMMPEDGGWFPDSVDQDTWITSLEKSIQIAPSYRRHLKLGMLYRSQADELQGAEQAAMYTKCVDQYEQAALRHPFDPVAKLNLANLHTLRKEYELANAYFEEVFPLTSKRERWFKTKVLWADMLRQWAGEFWKQGNKEEAGKHYLYALELLEQWGVKRQHATRSYLMVVTEYGHMLDDGGRFELSDKLYENAVNELPNFAVNGYALNFRREMGGHYLRKAKALWYKRQPEQAYNSLLEAQRSYRMHRAVLRGREDKEWEKGFDEVNEILAFFVNTGIGGQTKINQ